MTRKSSPRWTIRLDTLGGYTIGKFKSEQEAADFLHKARFTCDTPLIITPRCKTRITRWKRRC